jgi:hypothetical protein
LDCQYIQHLRQNTCPSNKLVHQLEITDECRYVKKNVTGIYQKVGEEADHIKDGMANSDLNFGATAV